MSRVRQYEDTSHLFAKWKAQQARKAAQPNWERVRVTHLFTEERDYNAASRPVRRIYRNGKVEMLDS